MKKTLLLMLVLSIALMSMFSCGGDKNDGNTDAGGESNTNNDTSNQGSEKATYRITWIDEKGNTISSSAVEEGQIPSSTYTVSDTAEWDYTLIGWSVSEGGDVFDSIPAAASDATYYARVTAVKQKYKVTFDSNGGSTVESQTVEYGDKATAPETPKFEGHKFVGWSLTPDGSEPVDFNAEIKGNVTCYAIWNETVDVKALLKALLDGYNANPYSYIPESMRSDFSANLVDSESITGDYSGFVNTSDICYGFGEQWHMVLDNLSQSMTFFNVLSVVDGLTTASITSFNNYFDSNPSDTAHHEFESGIYNVTINFDGQYIIYALDYTATLPALGEQVVQIVLSMDVENGERTVRIQLGDANALAYKIAENSYEFAIKYLGFRRAMFSIDRGANGDISGKIYEYLTYSGAEIASSAEFYINDEYVSVVGNKSGGMVGFTGYICELYSLETGKMLGYEVQESLSSIVYNTLWFNLCDIEGINGIRYEPATDDTPAKVYVNGSSKVWEVKKVGGFDSKMFSRRFDIEFRTQYVYSYDPETEKYTEHAISVPMIFVQEENYDTFIDDVETTNEVTLNVTVADDDLDEILSCYDELIPVFAENKDSVTPDIIIEYIGEKITF